MNLERLNWTKDIKPNEGWAYSGLSEGGLFKLHFANKENAGKPEVGDLMLLKQHGYFSHLVRLEDSIAKTTGADEKHPFYRIAEILWCMDTENPRESAKTDSILGYTPRHSGGKAIWLQSPAFIEHWGEGNVFAFHERVTEKLALTS